MKVIVFGGTGMIGQGVLRECLLDEGVTEVLAVGRTPTGRQHPRLREIRHDDFADLTAIEAEFAGCDAVLFCLGVSSVGMTEAAYRRVTYDYTLAAARALAGHRPDAAFLYVSGAGTDSSASGRSMWARVKGETENALIDLLPNAYLLRPGYIQPRHGATSKTRLYRVIYSVLGRPLYPVLRRLAPRWVTATDELARVMLAVARHGAPKRVLETADIHEIGNLRN
jgi:uncharacterized protein YbjT (DUF2867 family)